MAGEETREAPARWKAREQIVQKQGQVQEAKVAPNLPQRRHGARAKAYYAALLLLVDYYSEVRRKCYLFMILNYREKCC